MSVAFKPDVSTLQIVEVDVSTSQKMGKFSRVIRCHSAEQMPVTKRMNGLSQKLGVLRHHFLSFSFIPQCPADIDFDNLLTPTLKSDTRSDHSRRAATKAQPHLVCLTGFSVPLRLKPLYTPLNDGSPRPHFEKPASLIFIM
jgi:hypothetical protein